MEPQEVIEKFRKHLIKHGYDDIDVTVRDNCTWSKTDIREGIVQKFIEAYRDHGRNPEIWPTGIGSEIQEFGRVPLSDL
jgi:acetylornithine deacetylase/succinyl-diaminopimelate desuccinylase-like protein